ncbi:MAG: ACP S-malonyltransferase [Gemmatimonadaceae bacterium]
MDLILLFPGQGSQKPGMGKDIDAMMPMAHEVFQRADAALGESLSSLCFDGPADILTLTHNAQPALLTHGAAVWQVVAERARPHVRAAAGHSLGEFTAWHVAGGLALEEAVRLVRRRGQLMFETGVARPGTMAAILGDPPEAVDVYCERASAAPDGGLVVAANYNSPGQVVISGEVRGVEKAIELMKAAGFKRAMKLNVSGAFHSPLMAPAREGLAEALRAAALSAPSVPVYANVTAQPVSDPEEGCRLLVDQLTSPVRWSEAVQRLNVDYPDALFVEMGPGAVLTGLVKKTVPTAQTFSCGTAAEIEQLLSLLPA